MQVLRNLMRDADVVAIQEAHLGKALQLPRAEFRDFHIYTSAHNAGRTTDGLLVLLRRSWIQLSAITPVEL
eukprot:308480-Amphidinium_carterae.1